MNTNELLRDLAEALDSLEGQADPAGMLAAWAGVVRGDVGPEDCYRLAEPCDLLTPRQHAALDLASKGPLSSGDLARSTGCSRECARLALRGLAQKGLLQARGAGKGRRYVL